MMKNLSNIVCFLFNVTNALRIFSRYCKQNSNLFSIPLETISQNLAEWTWSFVTLKICNQLIEMSGNIFILRQLTDGVLIYCIIKIFITNDFWWIIIFEFYFISISNEKKYIQIGILHFNFLKINIFYQL